MQVLACILYLPRFSITFLILLYLIPMFYPQETSFSVLLCHLITSHPVIK